MSARNLRRNVPKEMDSARKLANGTVPICVVFDTEEQIERAREWMRGKQKVKNVSVRLATEKDVSAFPENMPSEK